MRKMTKLLALVMVLAMTAGLMTACGGSGSLGNAGEFQEVDPESLKFPLAETATIKGLTTFDAGSESEPNNRTIFKRLEEQTNVHVEWRSIQGDQWGDKKQLEMSTASTLPEFLFNAGFSDADLLKYSSQGAIIPLEQYIDAYMPNLKGVFDKYPEYRALTTAPDGHIYSLPWIEQLGSGTTAIQLLGDMPFINKDWLDFLGLEVPTTVEDFEACVIAFRDNASEIQKHFNIEGSIIPIACIFGSGNEDPYRLINSFGEGYGDPDKGLHLAVSDEGKIICTATTEGFKEGTQWLRHLNEEGLIDPEAFTQEWATYMSKGKSGRYGVCFSWNYQDVATMTGFVPLPPLEKDGKVNITPATASDISGYDRGRCVVTANAKNPALICAWLDQMYAPLQSPQNNWGTYGEDDDFDIFKGLEDNGQGGQMLVHNSLEDVPSPVEVRQAEMVGGPLAILNEYYDVYVTVPPDARERLEWIADIYAPAVHTKYCLPRMFMTDEDNTEVSNILADLGTYVNTTKAQWIKDGFTDADWDAYVAKLDDYGLQKLIEIYQRNYDTYLANQQ